MTALIYVGIILIVVAILIAAVAETTTEPTITGYATRGQRRARIVAAVLFVAGAGITAWGVFAT